jgi:Fe-S oxidoreductase
MHKLTGTLLLSAAFLAVPIAVFGGPDDFKPEPGFILLFNGKNLDGWKTKKGDSLDGKMEAYDGRFKVVGGNLVIDPKVKGDLTIVTAKELKDAHIKFDFLPGAGCNNDLYFRGLKFDLTKGNVKNFKEGEWHDLEIIAQDGKVEFKCKGETQRAVKAKTASSPLGIRAEYGAVQIRRIRVKEMP